MNAPLDKQRLARCCRASLLAFVLAGAGGCSDGGTEPEPEPVVTAVTVAPVTLDLVEGGASGALQASVVTDQGPAVAPVVTWVSSNPSVASVNGTGTTASVLPVTPGAATISATSQGITGTATIVVKPGPRRLVVSVTGSGTLKADTAGLACSGSTCEGTFPFGTRVTLNADPQRGHRVASWGGDCAGADTACVLTLNEPRTASLNFEAKVEDNGLSREINDFVPPSALEELERMGMPIHPGATPPRIEGTYLMAPPILKESTVPGDPAQARFADAYIQFSDQDDVHLTVTTRTAQILSNQVQIGEGLATFVVGAEADFSVFAKITTVSTDGDTTVSLQVYSGRRTDQGVSDLHLALMMLDNKGNPQYIPNGTGRVIIDQDGLSPFATFPSGGRRASQRASTPDPSPGALTRRLDRESPPP